MRKKFNSLLHILTQSKFLLLFALFVLLVFTLNDLFYFYLALPFLGLFISNIFFKTEHQISFTFLKKSRKKKAVTTKNKKIKKSNRFFGLLIAFIISLVFFSSFAVLRVDSSGQNIAVNYIIGIIEIFKNDPKLLIILILITSGYLFYFLKLSKKKFEKKNVAINLFLGYLLGFFLALFLVFLVAFMHLNFLALRIRLLSSNISDPEKITTSIELADKPPKLINISGKSFAKSMFENSESIFGEFYSNRIISIIPVFINISNKSDSGMFLYRGDLYFTKIDQDSIEKVAPIISKKYVELSLDGRYVKKVPAIEIIGRQDYLRFREKKINEQIKEIQEVYDNVTAYLQGLYADISNANFQIKNNENAINSAISSRDYNYDYCTSAGYYTYYYDVGFHRYYSDDECDRERNEWNQIISNNEKNIQEWKTYISSLNIEISFSNQLQETLGYYIELVESQKEITVYELGLFEPENEIKVVLDTTKSSALADFFATAIHEYFHYTSYVSEEKVLPPFFEEALTEYFSRSSVEEVLNLSTNMGYPAYIDLIGKMIDDIGEDKMKDIYLTKNFELLKGELNNKYGEHFYDDTQYYFDVLPYLDLESQVNIVNDIMFRIGGEKIRLENIESTETEL
jgi:hypothetical protein